MIDEVTRRTFQAEVWDYYRQHRRHDLPWRRAEGGLQPYHILVSEFMLQQTQVPRVLSKYAAFLEQFPTPEALAAAPLGAVLRVWSGLGYNRRAKYLHQTIKRIVADGTFPRTIAELTELPGIGPGTAGAILAYAFNQPVAFVETNIRTVFIHHFFHDQTDISDKAVLKLVAQTLPQREEQERFAAGEFGFTPKAPMRNPAGVSHYREWYWALMDYGTYLKKTKGNPNHRSRKYAKQPTFSGSRRQIRGQVLRLLGRAPISLATLSRRIADERLSEIVDQLIKEGLVLKHGRTLSL